jgi:hypothetical protein
MKCGYFQTLQLKVVQGNVLSKMLRAEVGNTVNKTNKRSLKQLNSVISTSSHQNNENQLNGKNQLLTSSSKKLENSSHSSNNNSFNGLTLPSRKRQYEQLIEGLQRKTYEAPDVLEEPVMNIPVLEQETRQKPVLRRWVNSEMKRRKIDTVSTTADE